MIVIRMWYIRTTMATTRSYGSDRRLTVTFRVSEEEKAALERDATAAKLSVSDLARTRVFGEPEPSSFEARLRALEATVNRTHFPGGRTR
jgi:hypothetical protein